MNAAVTVVRILFVSTIVFELLSFLRIFKIEIVYTWLGLMITASVSWALLESIARAYQKKKKKRFHAIIWWILFVGVAIDAAGDLLHMYRDYLWWDKFVHFFVSAAMCFTLYIIANAFWVDSWKFTLLMRSGREKLALLIASSCTLAFGALYEIEEYVEDILFHTNRLGPGTDTADDLFMNAMGVLLVFIFLKAYYAVTHKRFSSVSL